MCAKCKLLRCQNRALAGENRRLKRKLRQIKAEARNISQGAQKTLGKKSGVPAGRYAYELGRSKTIRQLWPVIVRGESSASLLLALTDCGGGAENT